MKKRNLFAELNEGFEALKAEREEKIALLKVQVACKYSPEGSAEELPACAKHSISPCPCLPTIYAPTFKR